MAKSRFGVERIEAEPTAPDEADENSLLAMDEAVSLEELSAAYAKLLADRDPDSTVAVDEADVADDSAPASAKPIATAHDEHHPLDDGDSEQGLVTPRGIIEAILFVGNADNRPITADWLAGIMRDVTEDEVRSLVAELNEQYSSERHAIRIVESNGGYRLEVADDLEGFRNNVTAKIRETQLNQNAVDCLSLVAYKPGSTCEEVERLWGRPASQVLSLLVRKELLRVDRQGHGKSAKSHYYPTERFLNLVGISGLEDLPKVEDDF